MTDELTPEEIKNLPWNPGEKFALVNKETKCFFFTFDTFDKMAETLQIMTERHPLFPKLQQVENPNHERTR